MLNSSQFFGNLVSQYVNRYNRIAEQFGGFRAPSSVATSSAKSPTAPAIGSADSQQPVNAPIRDSAILAQAPTLEAPRADTDRAKRDIFESQNPATGLNPSANSSHEVDGEDDKSKKTGPSTYSSSFTKLRYKLNLKFDMRAIEQTVRQLSVRETSEATTTDESFERLFAGGFNFSADLKLSGISVNASATNDGSAIEKYRQAESIQKGRGLQRAAAQTKESLPVEARGSYQVAVNRFSLRYKTDTQFSVSHFSRFQSQVKQLKGDNPESVGAYSNQAGLLAQSASNDVVGKFFDTVDGYLQNKEANLIENAQRFFDMAAESLGLSAEAVATAKASVTNTIESFFDAATSNLSSLQSQFAQPTAIDTGKTPTQAPLSLDGVDLSQLTPTPQPQQASIEDKNQLLSVLMSALKADDDHPTTKDKPAAKHSIEPSEKSSDKEQDE